MGGQTEKKAPRLGLEKVRFFRGKTLVFRQGGKEGRIVKMMFSRLRKNKNPQPQEVKADSGLDKIISAWSHLPAHIQKAILVMIGNGSD
jgi:hypothetical protein